MIKLAQINTGPSTGTTNTNTGSLGGGSGTGGLYNPLGNTDLWTLINTVLTFLVRIGAVVIVLMLVYVGFQFVTARGEPGALIKARQALLWTIIGALVLLGAKAISLGICATAQSLSTTSSISCPAF